MIAPSRSLRTTHRAWLVAASLLALAFALASCAGLPGSKSSSNHACADKVANAFVVGGTPPAACMTSDLQALDWKSGKPFASAARYIGESDDNSLKAELYDLTFTDQTTDAGKGMLVIVWVDPKTFVVQAIGISYRVL